MNKPKFLLCLMVAGLIVSNVEGMKPRWRLFPTIGDIVVAGAGGYAGYAIGDCVGYNEGYRDGSVTRSYRSQSNKRRFRKGLKIQCQRAVPIGSVLAELPEFKALDDLMLDSMSKLEKAAQETQHHVIYQKANNYGAFCLQLALGKKGIYVQRIDWEEEKESSFGLRIEDAVWDIENLDLDIVSEIRKRITAVMKMECQYFVQYVFSSHLAYEVLSCPIITYQPFVCNIELFNQLVIADSYEKSIVGNGCSLPDMSILFTVLPDDKSSQKKIKKEVAQIIEMLDELELGNRKKQDDNLDCFFNQ